MHTRSMRSLAILTLLAAMMAAGVRAARADEAHDLLDKAIAAQGGEQQLAKTKASIAKAKGTIPDLNNASFTSTVSFAAPNRLKQVLSLDIGGNEIRLVSIVNGDKCTLLVNEQSQPENPLISQSLKRAVYQYEVMRLVPLKDAAYKLQVLPEVPVDGKPAVGLRVSKAGQSDMSLYFDKQSHLLARVDGRTIEPSNGQEYDEQATIKERMVEAGVTLPKKIAVTRNGNAYVNAESTEHKFVDSLPESEFGG